MRTNLQSFVRSSHDTASKAIRDGFGDYTSKQSGVSRPSHAIIFLNIREVFCLTLWNSLCESDGRWMRKRKTIGHKLTKWSMQFRDAIERNEHSTCSMHPIIFACYWKYPILFTWSTLSLRKNWHFYLCSNINVALRTRCIIKLVYTVHVFRWKNFEVKRVNERNIATVH